MRWHRPAETACVCVHSHRGARPLGVSRSQSSLQPHALNSRYVPPAIRNGIWQYELSNLRKVPSQVVVSIQALLHLTNDYAWVPMMNARERQNILFVVERLLARNERSHLV